MGLLSEQSKTGDASVYPRITVILQVTVSMCRYKITKSKAEKAPSGPLGLTVMVMILLVDETPCGIWPIINYPRRVYCSFAVSHGTPSDVR